MTHPALAVLLSAALVTNPLRMTTYRYDGLGRRIEQCVQVTCTRYVYDQEDIALEFDGTNVLQARWTHGPGIDEPLLLERDRNGNGTFESAEQLTYHADGLGSIVALTDASGTVVERYRYESFGLPRILGPGPDTLMDTPDDEVLPASAFGNPFLFTGREYDPATGLLYYRARYLDPRTGTFLQEDLRGGDDVHATQRYLYAEGNPVNLVDPSGQAAAALALPLVCATTVVGILICAATAAALTVLLLQASQATVDAIAGATICLRRRPAPEASAEETTDGLTDQEIIDKADREGQKSLTKRQRKRHRRLQSEGRVPPRQSKKFGSRKEHDTKRGPAPPTR
jgi:RHS repeat-associated protein